MNTSGLVPRPRPAFGRLQYKKVGESLVTFLTSDVRIEPMVKPVPLNMGALGLRTGRK